MSEQLGHAGAVFTLDIDSHALPNTQEAAAAKLERLSNSHVPLHGGVGELMVGGG